LETDNILYGLEYTTIVATRNVDDFNSIREILDGITDATISNQYVIYVPKGRWQECDLNGKDFIHIVGQSRSETVIFNDGNSTKVTPADYSIEAYQNTALNEIPQIHKHSVFVKNNISIQNITIETEDCKYPIHIDYNESICNFYQCKVRLINDDAVDTLVGIGLVGAVSSQTINFKHCIFSRISQGTYAFYIHNWNNQVYPTYVNIENSRFINCDGYAYIQELGSNRNDLIRIVNCVTDYSKSIYYGCTYDFYLDSEGEHVTDYEDVPYCIRVNIIGTPIDNIYPYNQYEPLVVSRPLYEDYITIT